MESTEVTIVNSAGLHARPAMMIVQMVEPYEAELTIHHNGYRANMRSIMELIALGVPVGSRLKIEADGPHAMEALGAVSTLFMEGFGEA